MEEKLEIKDPEKMSSSSFSAWVLYQLKEINWQFDTEISMEK